MTDPTTLPEGGRLMNAREACDISFSGVDLDVWTLDHGWVPVEGMTGLSLVRVPIIVRDRPEPTWQERLLAEYPDAWYPERIARAKVSVSLRRNFQGGTWWDADDTSGGHYDTISAWRLPDGEEVPRPEPTVTIPLSVAQEALGCIQACGYSSDIPTNPVGVMAAAIAEAEGRSDG